MYSTKNAFEDQNQSEQIIKNIYSETENSIVFSDSDIDSETIVDKS